MAIIMRNHRALAAIAAAVAMTGLLLATGCASKEQEPPPPAPIALTEAGARIQIISASQAQCYQYVGIVQGSSKLVGTQEDAGYQSALNEALNKAASMGADYLVIDDNRSVHRFWTDQEMVFATTYKKPYKPDCTTNSDPSIGPDGG